MAPTHEEMRIRRLAQQCGGVQFGEGVIFRYASDLEKFYHAARSDVAKPKGENRD